MVKYLVEAVELKVKRNKFYFTFHKITYKLNNNLQNIYSPKNRCSHSDLHETGNADIARVDGIRVSFHSSVGLIC